MENFNSITKIVIAQFFTIIPVKNLLLLMHPRISLNMDVYQVTYYLKFLKNIVR